MPSRKLVPVLLTFGVMVGLIVYAATRPKQHVPEQERTVRELEPLTEAECKQFGEDFARAVSRQYRESLREALRLREITESAIVDLEVSAPERRELLGDNAVGAEGHINRLLAAINPDDQFTVRRVRRVNDRWVATFRVLGPRSVNFFELALARYPDGSVGAADFYDYYNGYSIRTVLRETAFVFLAARRRSLLDRLTGSERALAENQKAIDEALRHLRAKRPKAALTELRALPEQLRDQQTFRSMLFATAEATGDPKEYTAEVERALARTPDDPTLDLRLVAYCVEKRRFADALRRIDRLNAAVGGDAYFTGFKADVLYRDRQLERAKGVAEQAFADEPSFENGYSTRLSIAVEERNHPDTLVWLKKGLEARLWDTTAEALATNEVYAEFVKSPQFAEFAKWLAERKK